MSSSYITHGIRQAICAMVLLCFPALGQDTPPTVSKFLSSGNQAYLEVTVDGTVQKIYTEHRADYQALFVLGEQENPELLKFSFVDSSKRIVTRVYEFRSEKDQVPPGSAFGANELVKSLQSDEKGFADWQTRFASFPEEVTESAVITDASLADPMGIRILEGDGIVFRMKDWLCFCKNGGFSMACADKVLLCVLDSLCVIWDCVETGEWTSECADADIMLRVCTMNDVY